MDEIKQTIRKLEKQLDLDQTYGGPTDDEREAFREALLSLLEAVAREQREQNPQPSQIGKYLEENLKYRQQEDEFGFTGRYNLCAKEVWDVMYDNKPGLVTDQLKELL